MLRTVHIFAPHASVLSCWPHIPTDLGFAPHSVLLSASESVTRRMFGLVADCGTRRTNAVVGSASSIWPEWRMGNNHETHEKDDSGHATIYSRATNAFSSSFVCFVYFVVVYFSSRSWWCGVGCAGHSVCRPRLQHVECLLLRVSTSLPPRMTIGEAI